MSVNHKAKTKAKKEKGYGADKLFGGKKGKKQHGVMKQKDASK
jgi:hypothetical protein